MEFKNFDDWDELSELLGLSQLGEISYGLFHDLINNFTMLSLLVEENLKMRELSLRREQLYSIRKVIFSMESTISSIKVHNFGKKNKVMDFFVKDEINHCLKIFSYIAKKKIIDFFLEQEEGIIIRGRVKIFLQLLVAVVIMFLDVCDKAGKDKDINVKISVLKTVKALKIKVSCCDYGFKNIKEISAYNNFKLDLLNYICKKYFSGKIIFSLDSLDILINKKYVL